MVKGVRRAGRSRKPELLAEDRLTRPGLRAPLRDDLRGLAASSIQRDAISDMSGGASQPVACRCGDNVIAMRRAYGATTNAVRRAGVTAFEKLLT